MDFAAFEGPRAGAYCSYVRTRGADETGERREINPAGVDNCRVNLYI